MASSGRCVLERCCIQHDSARTDGGSWFLCTYFFFFCGLALLFWVKSVLVAVV